MKKTLISRDKCLFLAFNFISHFICVFIVYILVAESYKKLFKYEYC